MATLSNSEEDAYYRNDSLKSVESQHRVCQRFGVVLVHSQVAEGKKENSERHSEICTFSARAG